MKPYSGIRSVLLFLLLLVMYPTLAQHPVRFGFARKNHNTLSLSVSQDGKKMATGGDDHKVVVWSAETGQEINVFSGNSNWVTALAFDVAGKFLAAGDKDGKVLVFDLGTGMIAYTLEGPPATIYATAFSPRNNALVTATSDGQIRIWDISTHQVSRTIKASDKEIMAVRFSPDGSRLLSAGADGVLKEWESGSGKLMRSIEAHPGNYIRAAAYSPDGKRIATGSDDKTVKIWDTGNGQLVKELPKIHKKWLQSLEFASDNKHLVSAGHDGAVVIWNAESGESVSVQKQGGLFVAGAAFSRDLKSLLSVGYEGKGTAWDIASLGLVPQTAESQSLNQAAAVPGKENQQKSAGNIFELVQPRVRAGSKFVCLEDMLKIRGKVELEVGVREIVVMNKQSGAREKMRREPNGVFEHSLRIGYLDNDITIEVTDTQGRKLEKTFTAYRIFDKTNASELAQLSRSGSDYALVIATNSYQAMNPLVNPVFDANAISNILETEYSFQVETLIDPSLAQITLKIREYAQKLFSEDDQLFIFIAGHGEYDDFYKEGYLVASDSRREDEAKTSYLPHSALRTYINNIPCKHIFLAMDVCFGGTFDPHIASSRGDAESDIAARAHFIKRKMASKTRLYLTSGGKEYVPDGRPGQHSPFARKLLEAFSSYGGSDKILTYKELLTFVEAVTPEPRFGDFGDNEPGSDFIFIAR